MGRRISKEFLHPSILEGVNNKIGNLDSLETDAKDNMVQAINELVEKLDNSAEIESGKELIANAVGEPLTAEESFDEMSNDINSLLSTFKTNMMNNGITVESSDRFKSLIDKIATMVEEGSGKGIQFAEGIIDNNSILLCPSESTETIDVDMNLNFIPSYVFVEAPGGIIRSDMEVSGNSSVISNLGITRLTLNTSNIHTGIKNVSAKSFSMYTEAYKNTTLWYNVYMKAYDGKPIKWYAVGVGEEDTTLRDSLASILTEEGVSVTEEDDMASLISKVDEEFTKDNNTVNNLNSQILELESNLNNLTNDNNITTTKWSNLLKVAGYNVNESDGMNELYDILNASCITTKDVKEIYCGNNHTFIIKNDGSVWACGYNIYGQLGLGISGSSAKKTTFTQVTTNISDVKQIACGQNHTFILKNDGSIWSCGLNDRGELGLNSDNDTYTSTFTQVTTNINNDVKQIACGGLHTFILKNDGSLWSCGNNSSGRLGLGTSGSSANKTTFTKVTTNINNDVKQISCGGDHTFILKNDGSVWSCGYNYWGQLGLGNDDNKSTFTQVTTNISDVKQIACGGNHTFILKNDGSIWACGYNAAGNLGLGSDDTEDHVTFVQVTTNINNDVNQIVSGYDHIFILKNDGSVWACGRNTYGDLGLNTATTVPTTSFTQVTINADDVKDIVCGKDHSFILKNDGTVWSCGYNNYGQLGLNNTSNVSIFTKRKGFSI